MKNLKYLDISNNTISELVPQCLRNMSSSLVSLNIKFNMIQGPLPMTICNMKHLKYLDISNNMISELVPQCLRNMSSSLVSLNVKSNMIQGPFPTTICNMSSLLYLDMSHNRFHGVIPPCFGNIISSLLMIDLGGNKFHGTIPKLCGPCELLERLILDENKLEGDVPRLLSNCQSLKILDLGNKLNGTFPRWLGDLQKLKVLILRSNNLHGTLETSPTSDFPFPSLRIFDISNNNFVGRLPGKYFENFNTLNDMDKGPKTEIVNSSGWHSINVPVKGLPLLYPIYGYIITVVDLSSNRFEGEIPNVIGNLKSLMVLNLSNNNLSGEIPFVLGNLVSMESLDLSRNQLVGEIPHSLVNLKFLSILNLSQNHLMGRIPLERQFSTFAEDSYYGNPGLCGPPLPRDCKDLSTPKAEGGVWIYIEPVMLGLGCGTLLGLLLGYRMLSTGRPKLFNAIADAGGHTKRKKRKHVHIRKRN